MTYFVFINDVDVTNNSVTVNRFQAISTFSTDPIIPGELILEIRRVSDGVSIDLFQKFVTVGEGGDVEFTVPFSGLESNTEYDLLGTLINTSNNAVVATKTRRVTTLGGTGGGSFVFGDLTASIVVTNITQNSAGPVVTITNKTTKSGAFAVAYELRDSNGITLAIDNVPQTISANGTASVSIPASSLQAATTYEVRAFAISEDLTTILSTLATKIFTTQSTDGGGGGEQTDLRPYALAAAGIALVLLVSRR